MPVLQIGRTINIAQCELMFESLLELMSVLNFKVSVHAFVLTALCSKVTALLISIGLNELLFAWASRLASP